MFLIVLINSFYFTVYCKAVWFTEMVVKAVKKRNNKMYIILLFMENNDVISMLLKERVTAKKKNSSGPAQIPVTCWKDKNHLNAMKPFSFTSRNTSFEV